MTTASLRTEAERRLRRGEDIPKRAEVLGISRARVSQLVKAGMLEAHAEGAALLIDCESVESRMSDEPARGRPHKNRDLEPSGECNDAVRYITGKRLNFELPADAADYLAGRFPVACEVEGRA